MTAKLRNGFSQFQSQHIKLPSCLTKHITSSHGVNAARQPHSTLLSLQVKSRLNQEPLLGRSYFKQRKLGDYGRKQVGT
ncbi:Lysophospholipase NTE1 [Frankliniella fusca]|uniref:Lysophospholipase NTE1 n=1 Tax=Frankliniella fusca TaxID=407009 RepID=A0AAE1HGQ3_9NEOP|nr:Lysophospholipase NTE1 [Frankliniella fusca]